MPFYPQSDEPLSVMDNALQEPTGFDVSLPKGTNPEPLQQQPSVWDAAFRQNNLLAGMFRPAKQFEPADGYNPYSDKNELKGYEQWGSAFADSKSPEETAWIKNQIDDENEDRRVLSETGAEGTLASIAAGIIDPVTVASMFIPGAQEAWLRVLVLRLLLALPVPHLARLRSITSSTPEQPGRAPHILLPAHFSAVYLPLLAR